MKFKIDKSVPGEVSSCDDCEFYKHIRDMEGDEFHYCRSWARNGPDNGALRMRYKVSECDFFSKDKSDEDFEIAQRNKAWGIIDFPDPNDDDHFIKLILPPREYQEFMNPYRGTGGPPNSLVRRGIIKPRKKKEKKT